MTETKFAQAGAPKPATDTKPANDVKAATEAKSGAKPEAKTDPKPDAKTEPKTEAKIPAPAPKAEASRVEAPKVDAPKVDAAKAEAPKAQPAPTKFAPVTSAPAKAETPKAAAPKADAPKVAAKVEAPEPVPAKPVAPKPVASKPVAAKPAALKPAAPKAVAQKAVAAKPAVKPVAEKAAVKPVAQKPAPASDPAFALVPGGEAVAAPLRAATAIGVENARRAYAHARETRETLQGACAKSADAASKGFVALNAQWLDMMRAQSDAALGIWRSAIAAPSVSEAVKAQTSGVRQAYETSAAHLKAISETARRVADETAQPLRSAFDGR